VFILNQSFNIISSVKFQVFYLPLLSKDEQLILPTGIGDSSKSNNFGGGAFLQAYRKKGLLQFNKNGIVCFS